MLNQPSNPVLRVAWILKFFAWGSALVAAYIFIKGLHETYKLSEAFPVFSEIWFAVLLRVFYITLLWLAAMTLFFWFAYVLLLLNRIAIHSRRQTRVLFNMLHPPRPASQIPDQATAPAPDPMPDLAPPPRRDPSLPRGFIVTGLDSNRLGFRLTYEWVTREDALAQAQADGLVEILDIQPLKNDPPSAEPPRFPQPPGDSDRPPAIPF
jgi:hypothetical protein